MYIDFDARLFEKLSIIDLLIEPVSNDFNVDKFGYVLISNHKRKAERGRDNCSVAII